VISDYFKDIELRIRASQVVADKKIDLLEFSSSEGMARGRLLLVDGSVLEFMEYLKGGSRLKYRFHLMDNAREMIFRYDDAPHHHTSTFPHHKHAPDGIVGSVERSLLDILDEVETLFLEDELD
jgi:hypothetical protein